MSNHRPDNPIFDEQESLTSEHHIRLEKVHALRALGINPWPEVKEVTATCKQILDEFKDDAPAREYTVAGRIMALRHHGKTSFAVIQDPSARLQLYIRQDILGQELFDQFKHMVDVGDYLWARGEAFRTKMGEVTLRVDEFVLEAKSLRPMPEKFHGLHDIETIYRQRYLDLIANPESKERFIKRSHLIRSIRQFLDNHGFIEVETPMLHPIPGGAAARPFVTHHNALSTDLYLRIAPELYLKRLVVGGLEAVYEINRNFRNEGISTRHNPEFTMLEFYIAHHDYHFAMDLVEQLLKKAAQTIGNSLQVPFGEHTIDFEKPFERISIKEAVLKYTDITAADLEADKIDATIKKYKVHLRNKFASHGEKIYTLFEELVEKQLIQPTFVTHFPIEVSPLAKRDSNDPAYAARFELFIGGMEISNGFNELNDPIDQASRFEQQAQARSGGDDEAHYFDADFILALEHGLPPTVGVGIGIDRLAMILTNTTSIKDVILFPTLKRKEPIS